MAALRKIYIVSPHIPPRFSGSGNFSLQQATYFASLGYQVVLLTLTPTSSDVENLRIEVVAGTGWYEESANRALSNVRLLWNLLQKIDREPGAVLHCMSPATWFGILAVLAAKVRALPVSFEPNLLGANDLVTISKSSLGKVKTAILKSADAEVCMSPALALLSQREGMDARRQHAIPNPVNTSHFAPVDEARKKELRAQLGVSAFEHALLFIGAIRDRKGVRRLIESFALVCEQRDDCALFLVGPTDKDEDNRRYTAKMKALIASMGLEERVLITGRVHNPEEWMQACDVFVFGSKAEGLPSVLLEASSAQLPVVAFDMPKITDYVFENGKNGFIVEDEEGFRRRVATLLDDPDRRQGMGRRAREKALREYDERVVLDSYIALFETLAQRGA